MSGPHRITMMRKKVRVGIHLDSEPHAEVYEKLVGTSLPSELRLVSDEKTSMARTLTYEGPDGTHVAFQVRRAGASALIGAILMSPLVWMVGLEEDASGPQETRSTGVGVLRCAAVLLPRSLRGDWVEEQHRYLCDLPTRRARLRWVVGELAGLPRFVYTVRTGMEKESA